MTDVDIRDIQRIVESVVSQCESSCNQTCDGTIIGRIKAEVSAKHVHLDRDSLEQLFGKGYQLTPKRDLSQPGQFLSEERVKLVTQKGEIGNVAILGPIREHTQVELSFTDSKVLGLNPPLRLSGCLQGADDVVIVGPKGIVNAKGSVIVAKAHVHMTKKEAADYNVTDGERISAKIEGERPVTLNDVIVRVSDSAGLALHMDFDEANSAMFSGEGSAVLMKNSAQTCHPTVHSSIPQAENKTGINSQKGKKCLVTETDARNMVSQNILQPPEGAILTPAAKDIFAAASRFAAPRKERGRT